jgi:hypothetical protein
MNWERRFDNENAMASVRASLEALTTKFVNDVLSTLSQGLDEEIFGRPGEGLALAGASGGRTRRRRSDVSAEVDRVAKVLVRHKNGVRAEDLRAELGIGKVPFVQALRRLIAEKRARKTGERRSTVYFPAAGRAKAG